MDNENTPGTESDVTERGHFSVRVLAIAAVQAALAIALFASFGNAPTLIPDASDLMLGILGAVPLFLAMYGSGPFNDYVFTELGARFSATAIPTLIGVVSALAIAEEFLFRGAIQLALAGIGPIWALVIANALFAGCYSVNKGGWATMFLFGCYLSALNASGDRDCLLRSIVAHAAFNVFVALTVRASYVARLADRDEPIVAA